MDFVAARILLCINTDTNCVITPWIFLKAFDYGQVFNSCNNRCGLNYLNVDISNWHVGCSILVI